MRTLKNILLVSLLAYSAASMAQLYECTNSDGKKTYAKVCPNDTVKEKELGDPALVSPGPPVTAGADKLKAQNAAFDRRREERKKAEEAAKEKQEDAKNMAQACVDAKRRLQALQSGKQSQRIDPDTGEHVSMSDPDRVAEIDGLNNQVTQNCK